MSRKTMKRLLYLMCCAVLLAGCANNSGSSVSDSEHTIRVEDVANGIYDGDYVEYENSRNDMSESKAVGIINSFANLTASENMYINIPEGIDHISEFTMSFSPRQDNAEFYNDFRKMFDYLFPDREFNDGALYYYGKNSYVAYENGECVKEPYTVNEKYDEIISGEEPVTYFYYTDNDTEKDEYTFLEFASPIGNDLSNFNKGISAKVYCAATGMNVPFLETFIPPMFAEYVGTYQPDSTESFKLVDKETAINDAVLFYENYINTLPYPQSPTTNICVKEVDVYKITEETYCYMFINTPIYDNIPFDYIRSGQSYRNGENFHFFISHGCMAVSDDVDHAYGIHRSMIMKDKVQYDTMISFESAVKIVSENMSSQVLFEVVSAELAYCSESDTDAPSPEETTMKTFTAWKIQLYNINDNKNYICYVNAKDGTNFCYYTYEQ